MSQPTEAAPVCYRHTDRETWIRCQRCERPICPDCMNSAAVGFQCPSCVKEGAKQTRTGVAPYGGTRSTNPALTSFVLIAMNVAVWVMIQAREHLVDVLSLTPAGRCEAIGGRTFYPGIVSESVCNAQGGASWVAGVANGAPWQIVTSIFAHQQPVHLLLNMMVLYFLGPQLEAILGRSRFLSLYLLSGLTGSVAVMLLSDPHGGTLGASGAGFGLMGALLVVAHKVGADTQQILVWLGINVAFTFFASSYISWQGHLGGLVGGLLISALIVYAPKANRSLVQWSGLGTIAIVSVALIVVRAAALT
ncbi:MAG: rhomboid family intramembrane serine protease [Propionibacteriales bacterium]|nr:rhomboid family intramembrane serine protease [Propionibacteriales bacterium]